MDELKASGGLAQADTIEQYADDAAFAINSKT